MGFKLALWIRRVIDCEASKDFTSGPLFRDEDGDEVKASTFEPAFFECLERIQDRECCDLILASVNVQADFSLARSPRRGSNTHAGNQKVDDSMINMNN